MPQQLLSWGIRFESQDLLEINEVTATPLYVKLYTY